MKKNRLAFLLSATLAAAVVAPLTQATTDAVEPLVGEMKWVGFNFAPRGWANCDGQMLPISEHQALFSLLGTTFGGDGRTTFALPDMRGRAMVHAGLGPGLSDRRLGSKMGVETVALSVAQMPWHSHALIASNQKADELAATDTVLAKSAGRRLYAEVGSEVMHANAIGATGLSNEHPNMMPSATLHCIISLQGVFPSRN